MQLNTTQTYQTKQPLANQTNKKKKTKPSLNNHVTLTTNTKKKNILNRTN